MDRHQALRAQVRRRRGRRHRAFRVVRAEDEVPVVLAVAGGEAGVG